MAQVAFGHSNGFSTADFWVQNADNSTNERFAGLVSSTGTALSPHQEQTYSEFTFVSGGLTYRYVGEWHLTADRGLLSGSVAANGSYHQIIVEQSGQTIASYDGLTSNVNFGTVSGAGVLGILGNLATGVGTLLFGDTRPAAAYANLHLAATPALPFIATAQDDTSTGSTGSDRIIAGSGHNLMYGGAGVDAAVFDFGVSQASLAFDDSGSIIITGPNSSNELHGFESYQFADGVINQWTGSVLVDDLFYNVTYDDVWAARSDPQMHYEAYGQFEGRDPNAFFSTLGYQAINPNSAVGVSPTSDYAANGWKTGLDPSAKFDTALYLLHNPDVAASGMDPLTHYLTYGREEGREIYTAIGDARKIGEHPGFDAEYYLLSNPDLAKAAMDAGGRTFDFAYDHFEAYGRFEGRDPNAVFDVKGYLETYTDVADAGVDPLVHYHEYGWREGRDPSGAFDTDAYRAAYTDVAQAQIDPMLHYLQYGAIEGRQAFADGVIA